MRPVAAHLPAVLRGTGALLTLYFIGAAASGSTQRSLFLHDSPWLVTYTSNWVPIRELTAGPALAAWLLLLAALACWPGDIQGWPRLAFHVVATLSLAGIVLRPSSRVVSALRWKPLAFVGMVSYGIYLLHLLVLDAVQRALSRWHVDMPGALFVVGFVGTVALAALSYRFFERPLLRLKDRWRSPSPARRSARPRPCRPSAASGCARPRARGRRGRARRSPR